MSLQHKYIFIQYGKVVQKLFNRSIEINDRLNEIFCYNRYKDFISDDDGCYFSVNTTEEVFGLGMGKRMGQYRGRYSHPLPNLLRWEGGVGGVNKYGWCQVDELGSCVIHPIF